MCQTCALRLSTRSRSVRSVYSLQTTTHESESQAERPRIDCVMTCVYGSNHSIIPQGPWPDGHTYTNGSSYNFTGPAALAHSPATTARPSSWLRLASLESVSIYCSTLSLDLCCTAYGAIQHPPITITISCAQIQRNQSR